jgi:hypothetical protein
MFSEPLLMIMISVGEYVLTFFFHALLDSIDECGLILYGHFIVKTGNLNTVFGKLIMIFQYTHTCKENCILGQIEFVKGSIMYVMEYNRMLVVNINN